jgi:uncharacterized protein YbcC (UPF0753/DUF2309 family)
MVTYDVVTSVVAHEKHHLVQNTLTQRFMQTYISHLSSNIHISSNLTMKEAMNHLTVSNSLDQTMVSPFGGATRFANDWTANRPEVE